MITAATAACPDLYFIEAFNPALDLLGEQLEDAGIRNLASVVSFSISDHPELFEGGWYTDSYVSPEFKARLDRSYPDTRLATHMMPYAYDSFRILVEGFESAEDVLTHIRLMTEYDGTAGKITKEAGSGNFRSSLPSGWSRTVSHNWPGRRSHTCIADRPPPGGAKALSRFVIICV